ncbi:MFS transporter [Tannockella kyphosi]|uniref:MFS transporter n=1 Tax=Tannockella kyphosi TaxID=2899121 RepID=UPI0020126D7F|nr:MFS transporter [Tannockella kyphosi]
MDKNYKRTIFIYFLAISFIALGSGMSDVVLANYFKDAYNVTTLQRAFIEFPRELPGVIAIVAISLLGRFGDIKTAAISQAISAIGILILAVLHPSFYTMTAILFIFSMGVHIYLPLQDSLAMSIMGHDEENIGKNVGKCRGIYTFFSLISAAAIFIGFRTGFFDFTDATIVNFVFAGAFFLVACFLFLILSNRVPSSRVKPTKFIFRKEYKYYYILAIMNGVQKQIVYVYSPWVIIEILGKGADTTSLLIMASWLCGIFFLPFLGKCLDRFGIRTMLYADALSFILVYAVFAFITYNLYVGNFSTTGFAMLATFAVFIFDRMSSQMGFIRSVYLNNIAKDKEEVLSTISFGLSLDHVVAICCSYICGIIWTNYGPHYIFILAASFSIVNLVVAKVAPLDKR